MKDQLILLFIFLQLVHHVQAQWIKAGSWQGEITYEQARVPFTFEVSYPDGEVPRITLVNASERRVVDHVQVVEDSLFILLEPFDVEIRVVAGAMSWTGVYKKNYRELAVPFTATYGKARIAKKSVRPSAPIDTRWDITFSADSPDESKGVGLFEQQGDVVTGTILTPVSDLRYFEGILDGDSLKLTSFDGAHAFAFYGKRTDDMWKGQMIYDDGYSEPWTAVPDAEAELPDPFQMVEVAPGRERPYYDLLAAGQGRDVIDPEKYAGKVLIIQLFGTWCPNSQDQTQYLVDWYQKNKEKEVAILASSFEANYTQAYGLERLESYASYHNIPYDVVLGGRLSKTAAAMPFPFMKKIAAFPTLVILDKEGYVRYVASYFNGPATGVYHNAFDERFNSLVSELLSE